MSWTDERVELLKKLWTEGLSASQIAAELGGVTPQRRHRQGASPELVGPRQDAVVAQPGRSARPRTAGQVVPAEPARPRRRAAAATTSFAAAHQRQR